MQAGFVLEGMPDVYWFCSVCPCLKIDIKRMFIKSYLFAHALMELSTASS